MADAKIVKEWLTKQWPTDYTKEKALNLWKAAETIAQKIRESLKEDGYV